jgi:hypothetical protein
MLHKNDYMKYLDAKKPIYQVVNRPYLRNI